MPRALRVHIPGGIYHVTLRGNHRQNIFVEEGDQRLLNVIVGRALEKYEARLHAYCWMSNHLHFLLQVGKVPLSEPMRKMASEFARAMQAKLLTTGHFFERRFHASFVDDDSYFLELLRYIHLNPVRASVVASPDQFLWSSHHSYVGSRNDSWVTTDFALSMFAQSKALAVQAYLDFMRATDATEWEPPARQFNDELTVSPPQQFVPEGPPQSLAIGTLDELIAEACGRFGVTTVLLQSTARVPYLTKVRAWIAHQAVSRHLCSLSAVARVLKRHESTLRQAILSYPKEIE